MSKVSHYKNFINEAERISGAKLLKLYISPAFKTILKKINKGPDPYAKAVANRILNIDQEPEDNLFSISYIDISKEKDDELTYLPANRAYYKMGWKSQEEANKFPPAGPDDEFWHMSGRQTQRVGKFINTLFDNFTPKAVDSFVNAYKAEIAATQIYNRFQLVSGEDIRYWYAASNYYSDPSSGGGQLGQSCMRYDGKVIGNRENCQPFFDIYVENPEKCKMLILTHLSGKLLGRAIVWGPLRKPIDKIFMDRIYTVKQSDVELFKKYANEKGWIYKYNQDAHDGSYMEDGNRTQKSIAVALTPKEYKYYPYMDTLKYYNPTTGRLGSDPGNPVPNTRRLRLEGGGGQYQRID